MGTACNTLASNASCTVELRFAPLTASDITGTIFVQAVPSDGTATLTGIGYLSAYGMGQGTLTIAGSQSGNLLNFGQVQSGQALGKILTLTNANPAGSAPITVRRVTSAPPFLSTTTCGSPLAVGQSCTVTVHYAPSNQVSIGTPSPTSTTDTGLLTLESDAGSSPDLINLAGNGGPVAVSSPTNTTPIATFTLSQSSLTFPTVAVGNSTPAQTVILNNTGNSTLHLVAAITTPDYTATSTCATVLPGTTCTFSVASTPQNAGTHLSALEAATDSTSALEFITLVSSSTPSTLTIAPISLAFGSVQVGSPSTLPVQVTNAGTAPVIFAGISTTGDYAPTGTCPAPGATLAAGASCAILVTFTPNATGTRSGVLSIATSASTLPLTVALGGTGIESQLLISPASLNFGSIALGASANLALILTNSGTAPVSSLGLISTGDFAVTIPCSSTILAAGASCTAQVTFTPTAAGTRNGTLTVVSSDKSSPATVQLTGTGVQSGSITLSVNGTSSATAIVRTGSPASFTLAVTPLGGFTGNVALTCAPVIAGLYITCSLQPSTVALAGSTVTATATLNTISSAELRESLAPGRHPFNPVWCVLVPLAFLSRLRRLKLPRSFHALGPLAALWMFVLLSGCGSNGSGTNSNIHFAPTGTYQYQVTASSTTGVVIAQTVTLNLTVQ